MRGTGTSADDIWIGLNDRDVENSFVWSDGTVSSYRYWSDDQPKNHGDCTRMTSSGKWAHGVCSVFGAVKFRYVCETQSPSTQSPTTITVGMNFVNYFYRL